MPIGIEKKDGELKILIVISSEFSFCCILGNYLIFKTSVVCLFKYPCDVGIMNHFV
jgi:hypothetical protein